MKKHFDYFCPGCDMKLSSREEEEGRAAECPRCGKKFRVPSKKEADKEMFLRKTSKSEDRKYAFWLKSRLRMIQSGEKKQQPAGNPEDAIPPWLNKAAERAKQTSDENPLKDAELIDMEEPKQKDGRRD